MLCGVCRALGLHAESAVLPGEDKDKFQQLLERLSAAWMPQDDREKSLVEQIAVNQWKLARIERSISGTIADLDHYRKPRLQRHKEVGLTETENYKWGAIWGTSQQNRIYILLPQVRDPDGVCAKSPTTCSATLANTRTPTMKPSRPSSQSRMAALDVAHVLNVSHSCGRADTFGFFIIEDAILLFSRI